MPRMTDYEIEELKKIKSKGEEYMTYFAINGYDENQFDYFISLIYDCFHRQKAPHNGKDFCDYAFKLSNFAKGVINKFLLDNKGYDIFYLYRVCNEQNLSFKIVDDYYEILKIEAQYQCLDSYFLYLEKNREYSEQFYLPKRQHLIKIGIIDALQAMLDDELDILLLSMPPGTQKTTLSKFFVSGVMGWDPRGYNLFYSHSDDITRMYYDGALDIVQNSQEYCWHLIFDNLKLTYTNAKREQFNVGKYKPFPSLQCTSVGAKNAGKVRCNRFLLCDDLIGGIEEALNKNTLDKLWSIYSVDAKQRKMDGCKEIHIATRWSVHDIIGRLIRIYDQDKSERVRVISIPDIDPVTGKSNFNYEFNGFTEEFYHNQELVMDDISYKCLYKQEPIEREGLLYHEEDLRRYHELPKREPDAIMAICDVKQKGTDFMFLPCVYKYDNDYYCVDCVCDDDTEYERQYEKLSNCIINNRIQECEFESNSGGDRVSFEVNKRVKDKGYFCNITDKPTETNKETRIIVNSAWVKANVLFKDKSLYSKKSDYGVMMDWLLTYSVAGKNVHDDVPDGWANFALFIQGKIPHTAKVEAIQNPFRTGGRIW